MKESKKSTTEQTGVLGLEPCFKVLEEQLTIMIDVMSDIKPLRPSRKELKKYRLALRAIERQVRLAEKDM